MKRKKKKKERKDEVLSLHVHNLDVNLFGKLRRTVSARYFWKRMSKLAVEVNWKIILFQSKFSREQLGGVFLVHHLSLHSIIDVF